MATPETAPFFNATVVIWIANSAFSHQKRPENSMSD